MFPGIFFTPFFTTNHHTTIMFKQTTIALLMALALPAFAQVGADSQSSAGATAQLGNVTSQTTVNLPGAPALQGVMQGVNYSGEYRVKGVPVNSAASSFSSPAVWRCATAGTGGAVQAREFGMSFGLGGADSPICAREFRIAIVTNIIEMRVKKAEGYDAALKLACGDDEIADALEGTLDQCAAPNTTARKARWDRERADAQRAGRPVATNAPAAPIPGWKAGG